MKFRMVDRILSWEKQRSIRGVKSVSLEEYHLREALGCEASLPETLVMESLFQLGNWLIMLSSDFTRMGLLVRTEEVRFMDLLRPAQSMLMEVDVCSYREDGIVFDGRGLVGGRLVALGRGCLARPVDLAEFIDPRDARVVFSEIYRPAPCAPG